MHMKHSKYGVTVHVAGALLLCKHNMCITFGQILIMSFTIEAYFAINWRDSWLKLCVHFMCLTFSTRRRGATASKVEKCHTPPADQH